MKSILVLRYQSVLAAVSAALLAVFAAPLANAADLPPANDPQAGASDPLAAPGAAAAALRTPVATLGDDGKDMKEMKEVTPPPSSPLFNFLFNIDFANEYVTPRGMIVANKGLTYQPLLLCFLNVYKGDGFINSFQIVGGSWFDYNTAGVSSHGPYGSEPKTAWVEYDPIGGMAVTFAKNFKLEATYTAFIMHVLDIGPSHHFFTKLSFDDTDYLHAFALHPYFQFWQEIDNKATDADLPFKLFGPAPFNGKHSEPGPSFYLEVGIDPSYTIAALGDLKFELPCRLLLPDNRFYGEYYRSAPTIGIGLYEVGAKATLPLKFMPKVAGSWSLHFGARYMNFVNDDLYFLNQFNAPAQPTHYTWQIYGGLSIFF